MSCVCVFVCVCMPLPSPGKRRNCCCGCPATAGAIRQPFGSNPLHQENEGKCSLYNSRKDKETMRTSAKYYACTGTEQKGLLLIPKHSSLTKDINSQHLPTSPKQLRSWATLS